jgi:hypothetical protein
VIRRVPMTTFEWEPSVLYSITLYIFIGTDELYVAPIIDTFSKMPINELRDLWYCEVRTSQHVIDQY